MSSRRSARVEDNKQATEKKVKEDTPPFGLAWIDMSDSCFVLDSEELEGSTKIAAFDLDHTLIAPESGAKFPKNRSDWKWWDDSVVEKLTSLHKDGFKIVIFTNQGGIEKKKQKKSDITGKIVDLATELDFPIQAFVAGNEDHYRKPFTTMWDIMLEEFNSELEPDKDVSFYCGDAAGRAAGWKKGVKKDFSVTDRKFAHNIGLKFYTPEELFLEEEPAEFDWRSITPTTLIEQTKDKKLKDEYASDSQEMVIMVGRPASGKSTFAEKYFVSKDYTRVNRDTLGTVPKCKSVAKEALAEGLSVVVDNTNGKADTRKEFIALARAKSVPVRCFYLTTPQEISNHLNYVRVKETDGEVRRIPDVAYRTFNKYFEKPEKSEGYSEIVEIEFIPDFRDDEDFEAIFKGYTPEGI